MHGWSRANRRGAKVARWAVAFGLMLSSLCGLGLTAGATDYLWLPNEPTDEWSDARNWFPAGVPGAGDTALIEAGQPILSAPTEVAGLFLDADLRGENLTVNTAMMWTDGAIKGSVTIAPTATLTLEGSDTMQVTGTLNNNGTVIKNSTRELSGIGIINNAGTWRFANSAGIQSDDLEVNNFGTIVKETSALQTNFITQNFLNSGRIVANTGTLYLRNGASSGVLETAAGANILAYNVDFADGASILGAGIVTADNVFDVVGTLNIGAGATFQTIGSLVTATNATFAGAGKWEWRRGILSGQLTTSDTLTAIFGGSYSRRLEGTLNLRGTTEHYLPLGSWTFGSVATLNNYGTYTIRATPADFVNNANGALETAALSDVKPMAGSSIVNYGTFNVLTDARAITSFINRGIFDCKADFIALAGTDFQQEAGSFLLNGATFTGALSLSGGALNGSGTIVGNVTNGGGIAPGDANDANGTLRIEGSYTQLANGSLALDFAGVQAGVDHDVLQMTGTANLSGTLLLAHASGFVPHNGQAFGIATHATQSGQFATVNTPSSDYNYTIEYGATETRAIVRLLPTVNLLSPDSGFTGTPVTITGNHLTEATQVFFGTAPGQITQREPTFIVATVPADATTAPVRVVTASGNASSAGNFAVLPRISGFAPTQIAPGGVVSIHGSGFSDVLSVTIGGVGATFLRDSAALIRATVPLTARTGPIVVTTTGGVTQSADLTVTSVPVITAVSPAGGRVGSAVAILGSGLNEVTQVFFGTAPAVITRREATRLIVTVPVNAETGRVRVVTRTASTYSARSFAVLPFLTAFAPSQAAPGSVVSISGSGFSQVLSVTIGGVRAVFTRVTAGLLRATVPVGARAGQILVTTTGGVARGANFTLPEAPVVLHVSPDRGRVGTSVTILGTALNEVTQVFFGTAPAVITRREAMRMFVTLPANGETGRVRVVTRSASAYSPRSFSVLPVVTAFAPSRVAVGGTVSIAGSGLTQITALSIGTVRVRFTRVSSQLLRVVVPVTASSGNIFVQTLGGSVMTNTFLNITPPIARTAQNAPRVTLSSAAANVANAALTLRFTSRLNQSDVETIRVFINGASIESESFSLNGSTLTIGLPADALRAGDRVEVRSELFGRIAIPNP